MRTVNYEISAKGLTTTTTSYAKAQELKAKYNATVKTVLTPIKEELPKTPIRAEMLKKYGVVR